jgi:hypothetical protein
LPVVHFALVSCCLFCLSFALLGCCCLLPDPDRQTDCDSVDTVVRYRFLTKLIISC